MLFIAPFTLHPYLLNSSSFRIKRPN